MIQRRRPFTHPSGGRTKSRKPKIVGNMGIVPNEELSKEQMEKAKFIAKSSTASIGKFTEKLHDEKEPKNIGRKRKFESNFAKDLSVEQDANLKMAESILKKIKKPINDQDEEAVLRKANKRKTAVKRAKKEEREEDIGDRYDRKNRAGSSRGGRGGRGGKRSGPGRGGSGKPRGGGSGGGGRGSKFGGRGGRGRK